MVSDIHVRNPKFDFSAVPRRWLLKSRVASSIANGANLLFPAGERFFIRSVRHYLPELDANADADLIADVRAFFQQEGRHAGAHEHAFEVLRAQGYDVDTFLRFYQAVAFGALEKVAPAKLRLAATVACEHFTAVLAEAALTDGVMQHADPVMRDLLLWHAIEEIEHRAVAFDVLQRVDSSYALRMAGLAMAGSMLGGFWTLGTMWLLFQDGDPVGLGRELRAARARRRRQALAAEAGTLAELKEPILPQKGIMARVFGPGIRDYVRPGFHPSARDLRPLVARALQTVAVLSKEEAEAAASLAAATPSHAVDTELAGALAANAV
jgi:hypothetical protein